MSRVIGQLSLILLLGVGVQAQTRRRATPSRPSVVAPKTVAATTRCQATLGIGVKTGVLFCDVLTGTRYEDGLIVEIPPHRGAATLLFTLYNRHTYSEELVRAKRSYVRYTATVGVLSDNNDLLSRAVVQNEFRSARDLVDRIGGGAGPGGVKAVAPTGGEPIAVSIPEPIKRVSIVGEKLVVLSADGVQTFTAPQRPIAVVSDVKIEYRAR